MNDIQSRLFELKQLGYCCTQMMVILILESEGETNSDLVRAVNGLCFGVSTGDTCGALLGGICVLSFYAGKGSDDEQKDENLMAMVRELTDWFKETIGGAYGGIKCDDILSYVPDKSACGTIVAGTYAKTLKILKKNDFEVGGVDK